MPNEGPGLHRPLCVRVTGAGTGGIATVLLDGDGARELLQPLFRGKRSLADAVTGDLLLGRLTDNAGNTVDEVVAAPLGKKESETGNEQIELSCHGGVGALAAVEDALARAGFVRGGEQDLWTRGHLNAHLSLIVIEARRCMAGAATARQAAFLLGHAQLQARWERLGFDMALGMRRRDDTWRAKLLAEAGAALEQFRAAQRLLGQHHVTLTGPVNAGKSTLANCLARAERHIVCAAPGTTVDRLDTPIELRGLNVLLTDTAGLRPAQDDVERQGQERAQEAALSAGLRLLVLDGSQPPTDADTELLVRSAAAGPLLLVLNKQDLRVDDTASGLGFLAGREPCIVSALTGAGVEALLVAIEQALLDGAAPAADAPFTERQANLIEQLRDGLQRQQPADELLPFLRRLVGTRPDPEELATVLAARATIDG